LLDDNMTHKGCGEGGYFGAAIDLQKAARYTFKVDYAYNSVRCCFYIHLADHA